MTKAKAETIDEGAGELVKPAPAKATAIEQVLLARIKESPTNPRKHFGELGELVSSIRTHGVLSPVLLRPDAKGGDFELVFGHRRFRASKLAGLATIPAMVRGMSDLEVLEAQVTENSQRADIHPLDEAVGYQRIMRKGYNVARLAERVGRTPVYIYDRVKLLQLVDAAQKLFLADAFTVGHAIILARLAPGDQRRAIDPKASALWTGEHFLQDPDAPEDPRRAYGKPVSTRELQAWVDKHTRFDVKPAHVDAMLFPETALKLNVAAEQRARIVPITHDHYIAEEARDGRTYGPRSWKRADGRRGTKKCEYAVVGAVVIGPARGSALDVCIRRDKCLVHWGAEIREKKRRDQGVAKASKNGETAYARQERERKAQRERDEQARLEWDAAVPELLADLVRVMPRLSLKPGGPIDRELLDRQHCLPDTARLLPRGKTPEQLVRHMAFVRFAGSIENSWYGREEFAKVGKSLGIDVAKILAGAKARLEAAAAAKAAKAAPAAAQATKKGKATK